MAYTRHRSLSLSTVAWSVRWLPANQNSSFVLVTTLPGHSRMNPELSSKPATLRVIPWTGAVDSSLPVFKTSGDQCYVPDLLAPDNDDILFYPSYTLPESYVITRVDISSSTIYGIEYLSPLTTYGTTRIPDLYT